MTDTLSDLYAHQAWADAIHWHVLAKHRGALNDADIAHRLRHIHQVQWAFLLICRGEGLDGGDDFAALPVVHLRGMARRFHEEAAAFLAGGAALDTRVTIPWFPEPGLQVTAGQALLQAAMHSHYHRGQNASRLRELGGRPPTTDLVAWWWKGRPEPRWD
jgi:uncharacterized damage-inducible protein DinB